MGVLRSASGATPPPDSRPAELGRKVLSLADLVAAAPLQLPAGRPDRTYNVRLGGGEKGYVWTINGQPHGDNKPLELRTDEKVRLRFENTTTMFHPMHLHGHTFQVVNPGGQAGARKDTMIVRPQEPVAVDFVADNPGQWMIHCHNVYHQQGGMMITLSYIADGAAAGRERSSGLRLVCDWLAPKTA